MVLWSNAHFFFKLIKKLKKLTYMLIILKNKECAKKSGQSGQKGKLLKMSEEFLLEMFYRNNENYRGKVIKYKFLNDDEILFKLKDGTQMIYDFALNGRRNIIYRKKLTDEQLKKEFRFRLRAMLIHAGITQKDFAEKIGINEVCMSRYLKGEHIPNYILLKRMADVLHCKVDDFYFEPLE